MTATLPRLLVLAVVSAAMLTGCGQKPGADSPRQLMERFTTALDHGGKSAFLSCFSLTGEHAKADREYLAALYDVLHDARTLEKSAADKFRIAPDHEDLANLRDPFFGWSKQLDDLKITETGAQATVTGPAGSVYTLNLVKVDGKWYIATADMIETELEKLQIGKDVLKEGRQLLAKAKSASQFIEDLEDTAKRRGL